MKENIFGLLAEFKTPEELLEALKKLKEKGFEKIEAYSPYPVEGSSEYIPDQHVSIGWITFGCGVLGTVTGFLLQYYTTVIAYPMDVGGRPLNSWPAFVPVCFELTILFGALGSIFSMFFFNKLPMPYHPVFNAEEFTCATRDRFFVTVEVSDLHYHPIETKVFLETLAPLCVVEVPA